MIVERCETMSVPIDFSDDINVTTVEYTYKFIPEDSNDEKFIERMVRELYVDNKLNNK